MPPCVAQPQEHTHEEMALIQNQRYLRNIFKEPPLISDRKGKCLKDNLVSAKL